MSISTFDFDEWAALAESAPSEFERRRWERVESLIYKGSNVTRLRGLQCRIDLERIRSRTAMQGCLRIYSLMWDSFLYYQTMLNSCIGGNSLSETPQQSPLKQAEIIPFKRN